MLRAHTARLAAATAGALAVTACALAGPAAALTSVRVLPRPAHPRTTVTVSFRAPISTAIDPFNERYEMAVAGPARTTCSRAEGVYTSSGRSLRTGQLVSVRVTAPYRHARWCRGDYTGTIYEFSVSPSSSCEQEPDPAACGEADTLVASFRFRITA